MDADEPAPKALLTEKGYDADLIRGDIKQRRGAAMIQTKRNRLVQHLWMPSCPAQHGLAVF